MAYQSLYRRYRPQTFGALLAQDHISGALRNAVRSNTVMHAYLFSGPRGTGKTSTARILAKALNCTDLQDGEPCDVCAACREVTAGTSMDVNELDAASNNGVDAMRDLVSRAALGTAGRRKVYIVDEVHMLSTAASNALLKTLEEPPDHVVFVLATTDPQKVLQTIISRTQHFEFKLVSVPVLTAHLRWVARDAQLELDDSVFEIVARRGNGSVRDALSALDQVVAAGGVDDVVPVLDDVLGGLADHDASRLLESVAKAADRGRDPRQLARDLIERLRQVFLASLAPLLVDPSDVDAPAWAARLPPARVTRAIEVLGETLVAMRDSLDPRINLEVALVRLARPDLDTSNAAIVERLDRLERSLAAGSLPAPAVHRPAAPLPETPSSVTAPPTPLPDAALPGRDAAPPSPLPDAALPGRDIAPPVPDAAPLGPEDRGPTTSRPAPLVVPPATTSTGPRTQRSGAADGARAALAAKGPAPKTASPRSAATSPTVPGSADGANPAAPSTAAGHPDATPGAETPAPGGGRGLDDGPPGDLAAFGVLWPSLLERLKMVNNRAKVLFASGQVLAMSADEVTIGLPNDMHRRRCEEHVPDLETVFTQEFGRPMRLRLAIDPSGGPGSGPTLRDEAPPSDDEPPAAPPQRLTRPPAPGLRPKGAPAPAVRGIDAEIAEIDLGELTDATDSAVHSTYDQLLRAFPGAQLVDEPFPK